MEENLHELPSGIRTSGRQRPAKGKGSVIELGATDYRPARYERKWVPTRNERNLSVMMELLGKGAGRGRLGMIYSPAGRGKTWTVRRYAAHNNCIHQLCWETWKTSELGLLQALCRELGIPDPPHRKEPCLFAVVDRLVKNPRAVFLDEMDLVPKRLDLVRQLTEVTAAPIVLIGENKLADHMTRNKRVWSRTFQTLEFEPVAAADIIFYLRESAGLEISPEAALILNHSPGGGDWRIVERLTIDLCEIANSGRTRTVTEEMAHLAVKMGLKGVST